MNLTTGEISTVDMFNYVPKYIGGLGVALRIWWEEVPPGIKAFDPENKLIIMTGPLTGTPAPSSGRCTIVHISPQSIPEQLAVTSIGGHFPVKLKWSGYDGIIVEGKASEPVYLLIKNGEPKLIPCNDLWGLGLIDTQELLRERHGNDTECYGIGPAGENLVRYAVIGSVYNAAGQGGSGAVMGSKNLKAICVAGGKNQIKIANTERFIKVMQKYFPRRRYRPIYNINLGDEKNPHIGEMAENLAQEFWSGIHNLPYRFRDKACSAGCLASCAFFEYKNVPAYSHLGLLTGVSGCVHVKYEQFFCRRQPDSTSFRKGFEVHVFAQQLGLNHNEILYGIVPWLYYTKQLGIDTERLLGMPIEVESEEWWIKLLDMIAHRKGFGDMLAEGLRRTVEKLGPDKYWYPIYEGSDLFLGESKKIKMPVAGMGAWGYVSRGFLFELGFPALLPSALNWIIDTRDPHHNKWPDWYHKDFIAFLMGEKDHYGSPFAVKWAKLSTIYGLIIDSLTTCWQFPLRRGMGWVFEVDVGEGTESTSIESELFSAVTGVDTSKEELFKAGERINTLFRAILIRNHYRNAKSEWDEIMRILRDHVDPHRFKVTVENFYEALGWDRTTGYPTESHLKEMDLIDVASELRKIGKVH